MTYRDLLGQRNIDFQKSIARVKNKLNEKRKHDKKNKLEIFKKLPYEQMDSAVLKEIRNEHKSFKKGLDKARDTMRDTDICVSNKKFDEFLQKQREKSHKK